MTKSLQKILWGIIGLAVVVGLGVGFTRYQIERDNRVVGIVMEWEDIERLARHAALTTDEVLVRLRDAGLSAVSVTEDSLWDIKGRGDTGIAAGAELIQMDDTAGLRHPILAGLAASKQIVPRRFYITARDPVRFTELRQELLVALGPTRVRELGPGNVLELTLDEPMIDQTGFGVPSRVIRMLNNNLIPWIPRLRNNPHLSGTDLDVKLTFLEGGGKIPLVLFHDDQVLGYPDRIPEMGKTLKAHDIPYGFIEFAEQKGDKAFMAAMDASIVRLHGISKEEMEERVTAGTALERFARAARERGIRLLLVRPYYQSGPGLSVLDNHIRYIKALDNRVQADGYTMGFPKPLRRWHVPGFLMGFLIAGVIAGLIIAKSSVIKLQPWMIGIAVGVGIFLWIIPGAVGAPYLGRQIGALFAAIAFPILGLVTVFQKPPKAAAATSVISPAIVMVMITTGIAAIGAVLAVGLLSDLRFLLGIKHFVGIKLAFAAVPVGIAFIYGLVWPGKIATPKDLRDLLRKVRELIDQPATVGIIALIGLLGLAMLILLIRSSNTSGFVPVAERLSRSWLENLLEVRPRTKEFMIGYPALFMAAVLFLKNRRTFLWVFLAAGSTALASLVNSFAHTHTPLEISLIRSVSGLILGIVIGLAWYGIYEGGRYLARSFRA